MKRHFVIGWFLLLALAACNQAKVPEPEVAEQGRSIEGPTQMNLVSSELQTVDSLMWQRPDSALALLLPWFDTVDSNETFDNHYANLLLSELLYKNDYAQANRAELLDAVAYFDSLLVIADTRGSDTRGVSLQRPTRRDARRAHADAMAFLSARAHYINGVGYYEQDSVVEACREYIRALEIMESLFDEKELVGEKARFMALTYTRLTEIFSDLYLHEQAIYFAQQSLCYYNKDNTTSWHRAWILNEIGSQYDMLDNIDSADYYYRMAIDKLNDSCNSIYRDIATHLTYLKYKTNGQTDTAVMQMRQLISSAETEIELIARYLTIGEIYYHDMEWDSALYYLDKVYRHSSELDSRKQASEWIIAICKALGREAEILEYANFLVPFANQEENNSAVKSQLTEIYNTLRQKKLEKLHLRVVKRNTTRAMTVIGLLVLAVLCVLVMHYWKKRSLMKQMEADRYAYKMKQKALSNRLKVRNETLINTIKRLEQEKKAYNISEREVSNNSGCGKYESFQQTQIFQEVHNRVEQLHVDKKRTLKTNSDITEYKAFALSTLQLAQLTKTVETIFPSLYASLKAQYSAFDRNEWLHCCLYLMQIDKMSVCVLLQEPYYTCRRCTLKLEDIFNCKRGLSVFLLEKADYC